MPAYEVRITKTAEKEIRSLDRRVQKRVVSAIASLANEPKPDGCTKLKGAESIYRIRVGDYRVVYEIFDKELIVQVVRVRHRRDVYRGL